MPTVMAATTAADDPAIGITVGWVAGGLVLAGWLKRNGHREMCSVLRTPPGCAFVALFVAHLAGILGRWDPFCALGRVIPTKEPR